MRILFAVMNPDGKYTNLMGRAIYVAGIGSQGSLFSLLKEVEEKINEVSDRNNDRGKDGNG